MDNKRQYGVDLLRAVSMMGIVCVHFLVAGFGREPIFGLTPTGLALNTVSFLVQCSPNLFAMISGYLYTTKTKIKSGNLIGLLVNLEAYSLLFTMVLYIFSSSFLVDVKSILGSLFPLFTGAYWYLTAYIALFLLIPWINLLIHSMTKPQYSALLGILFFLFCLVPTFTGTDFFNIQGGYSVFWLMFCYLLGGHIRLYRECWTGNIRRGLYPVILAGNLLVGMTCYYLVGLNLLPQSVFYTLESFVCPITVGNTILIFLYFADITIKAPACQRFVKTLSDAAFEVYVIHCHQYFFDIFIRGRFEFLSTLTPLAAIILLVVILVIFYLACSLCYLIRKKIFQLLKIDLLVKEAGDRVDRLQSRIWPQFNSVS